ncbi:MAG: hypothetical protein ACE5JP_15050 [Candidatus Bipolaricaulia bacterium]
MVKTMLSQNSSTADDYENIISRKVFENPNMASYGHFQAVLASFSKLVVSEKRVRFYPRSLEISLLLPGTQRAALIAKWKDMLKQSGVSVGA